MIGNCQMVRVPRDNNGPMEPNNPPGTALHRPRTGLEACRSLTKLSLRDNGIGSMAPLAGLTALRILDLTGNRVAVIEGINASSCATVSSRDRRCNNC